MTDWVKTVKFLVFKRLTENPFSHHSSLCEYTRFQISCVCVCADIILLLHSHQIFLLRYCNGSRFVLCFHWHLVHNSYLFIPCSITPVHAYLCYEIIDGHDSKLIFEYAWIRVETQCLTDRHFKSFCFNVYVKIFRFEFLETMNPAKIPFSYGIFARKCILAWMTFSYENVIFV